MTSNLISREDFDAAVKTVLKCFAGVTKLNKHQDNALFQLIHRHDVFAILPTGFGKSLIFQLLPSLCLELNLMGYDSFPQKCVVLVICPLVALIESHMNELPTSCPDRVSHERIEEERNFVCVSIWYNKSTRKYGSLRRQILIYFHQSGDYYY